MTPGGLRALEFDRVVAAVRSFALTPTGEARLDELTPATDLATVREALASTTETVNYLASNPVFPLRAPADLAPLLALLDVEGRALEPLRLLALADYLESVETSAAAVRRAPGELPRLKRLVSGTASKSSTPPSQAARSSSVLAVAIRKRPTAEKLTTKAA